jgi:general secretion pathway protein G
MEVLLVLVILVVLGSMAGLGYQAVRENARVSQARAQIGLFQGPLDAYEMANGDFPPTLDALRTPPAGDESWSGPYLNKDIPLDPWGQRYQYIWDGSSDRPIIWSTGPDKQNGTQDDIYPQ